MNYLKFLFLLLFTSNIFAGITNIDYLKLKQSAHKGNVNAQYSLGELFRKNTIYSKVDLQKSFKWHKLAANHGNHKSEYIIGLMYATGKGVKKNYTQAFKWIKKAAKRHNIQAEYNLGMMYAHGKGVKKNFSKAFFWIQSSAKKGYAAAQYYMGLIYAYDQHNIMMIDRRRAYAWFSLANASGFHGAREFLDNLESQMSSREIKIAQNLDVLRNLK